MSHIAFKCNYNDGDEGSFVGFNGRCSQTNIIRNIEVKKHIWCGGNSDCLKYRNNGFKGKLYKYPCYESVLFAKEIFGAGRNQKDDAPRHINGIQKGDIAFFTTRFPDSDVEKERKIIGFFKIDSISDDPNEETRVSAIPGSCVRLPLDEAKQLNFWDYYKDGGRTFVWGSGLFRYLSNIQAKQILLDVIQTVRDEKSKTIIQRILNEDYNQIPTEPPQGLRIEKGLMKGSRTDAVICYRKYGPGGEGKDHKNLKEWVAKHPEAIGLRNLKANTPTLEHRFICGDAVDILFEMKNGTDVVVEIETSVPLPGCHQAIKYRILRCGQRGIGLNSPKIRSVLVAWQIPQEVQTFCRKYGVEFYEIPQPSHKIRRKLISSL